MERNAVPILSRYVDMRTSQVWTGLDVPSNKKTATNTITQVHEIKHQDCNMTNYEAFPSSPPVIHSYWEIYQYSLYIVVSAIYALKGGKITHM